MSSDLLAVSFYREEFTPEAAGKAEIDQVLVADEE